MGNFEKLSVLVIVVIIVMILVVAIYTWTDNPNNSATAGTAGGGTEVVDSDDGIRRGDRDLVPDDDDVNRWVDFDEGKTEHPLPVVPVDDIPAPPAPKNDFPKGELPSEPGVGPDPVKEDAPTSDEPWVYTIKSGDTITEIAMRELGTHRRSKEIMKLNPDLDPLRLRVGQQIKMPPKGRISVAPVKGSDAVVPSGPIKAGEWYVTRRGDTLEKISKAAFRTIDYWPEIWAKNLKVLDSPDDITEGMRIFIPNVQRLR